MKTKFVVLLMITVGTFYSSILYAEIFQSEVRSVDPGSNIITAVEKNTVTGVAGPAEFQIVASDQTQLENFNSLAELRPGDEVKVDAQWSGQLKCWQAQSLALQKVKIQA